MKKNCLNLAAAAALLLAGHAGAQTTTTAQDLINAGALGRSSTSVNGIDFSAQGGSFASKTVAGITAIGVAGGASGGEIDIGQSITASFASRAAISSFSIAFLFDGPEFGDVREVARISLLGTNQVGTLTATGATTAIWSLGGLVTNLSPATEQGAGAWSISNPFGNLAGSGLRFEAINGLPGPGCNGCSNQSDYSVLSVSPVPEPSTYAMMLAGLAALAFMVRRRGTSAV